MVALSWNAELAFRMRVSMSAIGSVIVMTRSPSSPWFPGRRARRSCARPRWRACGVRGFSEQWYGGAGPACRRAGTRGGPRAGSGAGARARWRGHRGPRAVRPRGGRTRRSPGRLAHARELAPVRHLAQADAAETELAQHRAGAPAAVASGVAAHRELRLARGLVDQCLLRHLSVLPEREAELTEQRPALLVGGRGGDHGDVHAPRPIDRVLVDLVEHRLVRQTERVVAGAVDLLRRQTAEVADALQADGQQPVQELPHAGTAQGRAGTDRHALAQFELRDRLAGPADLRLLASDEGEVADRALHQLRVARGLADAHVDDDLHHTRDEHRVGVAELLLQRRLDRVVVALLQPRA